MHVVDTVEGSCYEKGTHYLSLRCFPCPQLFLLTKSMQTKARFKERDLGFCWLQAYGSSTPLPKCPCSIMLLYQNQVSDWNAFKNNLKKCFFRTLLKFLENRSISFKEFLFPIIFHICLIVFKK